MSCCTVTYTSYIYECICVLEVVQFQPRANAELSVFSISFFAALFFLNVWDLRDHVPLACFPSFCMFLFHESAHNEWLEHGEIIRST
jgi:hypothetical protein